MTTFTKAAVEQLSANLNEPAWMREFRLQAWAAYEALPMPSTTDEPWRRTNLRRFKLDKFSPVTNGAVSDAPAGYLEHLTEAATAGYLAIADGTVQQYHLGEEAKEKGVIFCDMHTAVEEHGELLQRLFMTEGVLPDEGKFAALHGAFWRSGAFLYVPKNVQIKRPFRSNLWNNGASYAHTLVVVEAGAEAILVEEYASAESDGEALHNGAVELLVRDSGNLMYVSLQDFASNLWQFTHERGRVGRDAKLDWVISAMGTRLTKAFQTVELDGRGAFARMSGLFFTDGRQHFDLDTQQNHNAPDTTSDLLYKGALKGKSRSVWQGMIKALPSAQRIDGFQANRNLILERDARADSIPGLEIEADDVRCTHASTVGRLDVEEIFYLMSRGIPKATAIEMVVQGFFDPVMQRIPLEIARDRIAERILEKVR